MSNNYLSELDHNDIRIVSTLDSLPHRSSTERISVELDIPSRSIRYRLSKLKEKNILKEQTVITHERKLGIRESFIIIEENPKYRETFQKIIGENPALSWYVPTSGKFQGFILHSINTMNVPDYPQQLLALMKENEIVNDYFHFEIIDYQEFGWNYNYFNTEGKWIWNWKIWEDNIRNKNYNQESVVFEENPEVTNFDYLDIQILKNLILFESITQKEIGKKLALSESQIGRRIRSMEQSGIIRGYRTGFAPFSETQTVMCMIKIGDSFDRIVNILKQIPYPKTIAFENRQSIGFGFQIPTIEMKGFLNGLHCLRPLIDSYFVQYQLRSPTFNPQISFDLFDKGSNDLNRVVKEYERSLEFVKAI